MSGFDHFVVADDFDRYGIQPGVARAAPSFLQIELTDRCNLSCRSCPRAVNASTGYILELDVFEQILQEFEELQHVSFVGAGEALFVDSFPRYVRLCRGRGIITSTVSNGLLVPARLPAAIDAGLSRIGISIDAADHATLGMVRSGLALTALRRSVVSAVSLARGTLTRVFGAITLSDETASQLGAIVELAADWGLVELTVESIHHWGDDKRLNIHSLFSGDAHETIAHIEAGLAVAMRRGLRVSVFDYKRLLQPAAFRDCHCPWPWDGMFLTCRGQVTPCCVNTEASPLNTLGDLHTSGVGGIWAGDRYREFRTAFGTEREWTSCQNCVYRMEFGKARVACDI
jgi:MoaA/NifB/PqqE/SkfB family radical SAM enzyme